MKRLKRLAGILATICGLGFTVFACTTTYTEADLRAQERREDAAARAEESRDRQIGEEGGANREAMDEQEAWVDRESDL